MAAESEEEYPVDNIQYDEENLIIRTPFYNLKLNENGGFDYLKSSKGQVIFNNNPSKMRFFLNGNYRWKCPSLGGKMEHFTNRNGIYAMDKVSGAWVYR